MHTPARTNQCWSRQAPHALRVCIWMHLVNGTGNSPSPGQPTPGVVKQDMPSGGSKGRARGGGGGGAGEGTIQHDRCPVQCLVWPDQGLCLDSLGLRGSVRVPVGASGGHAPVWVCGNEIFYAACPKPLGKGTIPGR